ncbi:uncharacterized protein VTP21DRAFT_7396 [Calcarisporiella thermophila]|uniref:uncharacterized protein n=1 Tax=Calcarisporiella thermophila TaxID=911321 RepID=UPI0037445BE3
MWPYAYTIDEIAAKLGCSITVQLHGLEECHGYLITVDPVTYAIYLALPSGAESKRPESQSENEKRNEYAFRVLFESAVKSMKIHDSPRIPVESLFTPLPFTSLDSPIIAARKSNVINFLNRNRIPIQSEADSIIYIAADNTRIEPPYVTASVYGDNEIVVSRVKKLMAELPDL